MTKRNLHFFVFAAAVLGVAGCGGAAKKGVAAIATPFRAMVKPVKHVVGGVKGVGKAVSAPFNERGDVSRKSASNQVLASRICTADYDEGIMGVDGGEQAALVDDGWSAATDAPRAPRKDSDKTLEAMLHPRKHEFDDAFEREMKQLREMEELTSRRASKLAAEAREKSELADQYRRKYEEAQARKARLRKILDAYRRNPDNLAGVNGDGKVFHQVSPAVAAQGSGQHLEAGDISSCSAPRSDESSRARGESQEYVPPIDSPGELEDSDLAACSVSDPLEAPAPTASAAAAGDPGPRAANAPSARGGKLSAMVLATDGTGPDAIVIIGAGSRKGVKKGMLFKLVDEKNRKVVLVVKDVYLTYARCYPHPAYAKGTIRVAARVRAISGLGE